MQDENALREVAKDCVHCGFCLPACPTYQLWAEEMDSPRGRIYLVNQLLDGAELTAAAADTGGGASRNAAPSTGETRAGRLDRASLRSSPVRCATRSGAVIARSRLG